MDFSGLGVFGQWLAHWAAGNSYALLFIAILIEGPAITAAGAFAAALGFLNIWIVFALSVLANLIPDIIFYAIGFWGRQGLLDRYGHYFGITKEKIAKTETLIEKHSGKALIVIKMVPFIAIPGLIMVGATRMSIKKYVAWYAAITVPSSLIYLALGYYFGTAYRSVIHYLNLGILIIVFAVAVFFVIIYLERKFSNRLEEEFTKDTEKK